MVQTAAAVPTKGTDCPTRVAAVLDDCLLADESRSAGSLGFVVKRPVCEARDRNASEFLGARFPEGRTTRTRSRMWRRAARVAHVGKVQQWDVCRFLQTEEQQTGGSVNDRQTVSQRWTD